MQEILEVSCRPVHDGIWTPAELMGALERAATDHADALNIGHAAQPDARDERARL